MQYGGPPVPPYASPLLNEIHTLFPALLYDSYRFTSVYSVMQYIQAQMAQRYDIFSHNRNQYLAAQRVAAGQPLNPAAQPFYTTATAASPAQVSSAQPRRIYVPPHVRARRAAATAAAAPPTPPAQQPAELSVRVSSELDPGMLPSLLSQALMLEPLTAALLSLGTAPVPPQPQQQLPRNFYDPVIVAPTAAQIQNGTTVLVQPGASDTPCAICQDAVNDGDLVRQLLGCRHTFHRSCIDVWLQRNVHCPVCRHDIRVVTPPSSSSS